ncbi:MAG: hypothetical protein RSC80_02270 [Odoribacter sp.]
MKQEVTNFGRFYSLLRLMPGVTDADEMKNQLVWKFTDLRTDSLREMKKIEYGRMIEYMEDVTGQVEPERKQRGYYSEDAKMWRKRSIAAVFGFYEKIKEPVTMEYVKGIICRAGKAMDINQIPPATMREIYNVWLTKQKVKGNVDKVMDAELVKFGYLEKGGAE